jgi:hypothetical protein
MPPTITTSAKRLASIRDFLLDAGTLDKDALMSKFKIAEADYEPILRQLRATYPDEFNFEFDDDPTEQPVEPVYKLKGTGAFLKDLEVVSRTDKTVVLAVKAPKDLVTIVVKGKTVEVDLLRLRELPPTSIQHGVEVSRLIQLAELAK